MASSPAAPAAEAQFILNGVDALTGKPLLEPRSAEELARLALAEFEAARARGELKSLSELKFGSSFGMDVDRLDDPACARWGVVVPAGGEGAELRKALKPLIDHRAAQLGGPPPVFEVAPETSAVQFLRENGVERGLGVVAKVPYYLLIAGSPADIPFRFQMELNTEYATGRLHFATPEGRTDYAAYHAYAEHLVRYELAQELPSRREAVFWAPERLVDPSTSKSAPLLAQPLYDKPWASLRYAKRLYRGDLSRDGIQPATRENLREVLAGPRPPALLFTASHGMGYREPHPDQISRQGALLGQEYIWGEPVAPDQWYGAANLSADGADVRGMVHVAFACYGAGTPQYDDYTPGQEPRAIASRPFVAALPSAMLARGALAFVGHVDRAWGYSFLSSQPAAGPGMITPLEAFHRAMTRILRGGTIAHALRDEHDRGVHLSSSLLETIAHQRRGAPVDPVTLARLWVERNDARAYLLLGDPAARLRPDSFASAGVRVAFPWVAVPVRPANGAGPPPAQPAPEPPPGHVDYTPPITSGQSQQVDGELLAAWRDYIKEGFKQNSVIFRAVLGAFLLPYWLTVAMYVILFIFGLGGFALAAYLAVQRELLFAAIFGGLSVGSFLAFFVRGPLRSLERNLIFITWLGMVYNTYWIQLLNANNPKTVRQDVETITANAIKDLRSLVDKREALSGRGDGLDLGDSGAPKP